MPFKMVEMCNQFITLCSLVGHAYVLSSTLSWSPDCGVWCTINVKEPYEATHWLIYCANKSFRCLLPLSISAANTQC